MSSNGKPRVALGCPKPPVSKLRVSMMRPPLNGEKVSALALASRGYGLMCHWDGARLVIHWPSPLLCGSCQRNEELRWVAFYQVQRAGDRRYAVLALTREAIQSCPALDPDEGEDLTGRMVEVWRDVRKRGKPYRASLGREVCAAHVLPPAFNLAAALEHVMHLPEGTLYVPDDAPLVGEEDIERYSDAEEGGGS